MSLIIDDSYIEIVKNYSDTQLEILGNVVASYVKVMNNVIENGISEGKTAEALKEFVNQVQSNINKADTAQGGLKSEINRYCDNFIQMVDKADKELYD